MEQVIMSPNVKNVYENTYIEVVGAISISFENKGSTDCFVKIRDQQEYKILPYKAYVVEVVGAIIQDSIWDIRFEKQMGQNEDAVKNHCCVIICQIKSLKK